MKKEIMVKSAGVYEARALAEMVGIANNYSSRITIVMGNRSINAKSIMGIMGLGLDQGKVITIDAEGTDAEKAIAALDEFLSK